MLYIVLQIVAKSKHYQKYLTETHPYFFSVIISDDVSNRNF